jgi:hypothetical protein
LAIAALAFASGDAIAAAAAWHIETLPDNTPVGAQGCVMNLNNKDPQGGNSVFVDAANDTNAAANIKLGGRLFTLHLVSTKTSGKHGAATSGVGAHYDRVFKDGTGSVAVTSSLTITAVDPSIEATSYAGTLAVTYQGTTQNLAVEGGLAC